MVGMPKKSDFRQYAHANPCKKIGMEIPETYSCNKYPPAQFVDVGCGYGKFLIKIGQMFPDKTIYGMEIRDKVAEYVQLKIKELQRLEEINDKLRKDGKNCDYLTNVHVIRTNAMFFFPHFFKVASLQKIFILFPDPHFKARKHKFRMISPQTIPFYHYCLEKGGRLYVSTDVTELFEDMVYNLEASNLFTKVADEVAKEDTCFELIGTETDESSRAGSRVEVIHKAIFEKKENFNFYLKKNTESRPKSS